MSTIPPNQASTLMTLKFHKERTQDAIHCVDQSEEESTMCGIEVHTGNYGYAGCR